MRKWYKVKAKNMPLEMTISGLETQQAAANQFCAKHFPDSDWFPPYAVTDSSWQVTNGHTIVEFKVTEVGK